MEQVINTQAIQARRDPAVDLTSYDVILVNTSGGKDSSVMAHYVVAQARAAGVEDRIVFAHATFAEEWKGTEELVRRQIAALGNFPLEIASRGEDLLDRVARRGKWMDSTARYCTSDFKRDPIEKVIRRLASTGRVLNCIGIRAAESSKRAQKSETAANSRLTTDSRTVTTWHPIFRMSDAQVWNYIREHGIEQHEAYALGMPRLSCVFCVFAGRDALLLAGKHNPELLDRYVAVEKQIGHTFQKGKPIAEIKAALERGEQPQAVKAWTM